MEASIMPNPSTKPRILLATPEVAIVPESSGNHTYCIGACSGRFGDFPVELINDLSNMGVDIHVAQPDYRKLFEMLSRNKQANPSIKLPIDRVHLAEDRAFFYSKSIKSNYEGENIKISLIFQREVINQMIPRVQPDLIHCHDWMTGLIPAAAKQYEIPCLFTVRNADSAKCLLSCVEDKGIDAAAFWTHLFYERFPGGYEDTRNSNPLDLLLSGILAARHVSTSSFTLMSEIFESRSKFYHSPLRQLLAQKWNAGCVCTITGSSNPICNPGGHEKLHDGCWPSDLKAGKQKKNYVIRHYPFTFDDRSAAQRYVDLYETILQRPLVAPESKKAPQLMKKSHTRIPDGQAIPFQKARSTQSDRNPHKRISTPAMAPI
jgi:starch synthase/alpha-amylase